MVPLLEPPLLFDCLWEEDDDTDDSARRPFGVGDGEGVSVGDVLLEVEEFPDGGRFTISIFCLVKENKKKKSLRNYAK